MQEVAWNLLDNILPNIPPQCHWLLNELFQRDLFWGKSLHSKLHLQAIITVNLTSMLVLTTMFINVSNNLPKTSYMKMIDVWLLFHLLYPFLVVLIHNYMDTLRNDDEREINKPWQINNSKWRKWQQSTNWVKNTGAHDKSWDSTNLLKYQVQPVSCISLRSVIEKEKMQAQRFFYEKINAEIGGL